MTVDLISIREFKCFESLDVPCSPLSVLTGFNAAGKSTTLQALLLMAQGFRSSPYSRWLPLNGSLVKLGSVGDVVRNRSRNRVEFGISGFGHRYDWKFGQSGDRRDKFVDSAALTESDADDEVGERERLRLVSVERDGVLVEFGNQPRIRPPADGTGALRRAIREVIYIGATRETQSELFPSPDDADPVHADVGYDGRFAPWWYVRMADNSVPEQRRQPSDPSVTFRSQVDAWLGHLFSGAEASAEAVSGTRLCRLVFRMDRGGWSRPSNIGFGLSYAFPLIVALLAAREGQIVVVDSPEAHLHPRAQSHMGRMLSHFAQAGVQVLVETHSDHVLSGIRLAVRQQIVRPEDVGIHFFSGATESHGGGIISPVIDRNGRLSHWPDGFFDQTDADLMALAAP